MKDEQAAERARLYGWHGITKMPGTGTVKKAAGDTTFYCRALNII